MYFFTFAISAIVLSLIFDATLVTGDTFGSTINFYHGTTVGTFSSYNLATGENVSKDAKFNSTRKTVMFIHGYNQSPYTAESQALVQTYIINDNYNILVLNWSQAASGTLQDAASRVDSLGSEVAGFIFRISHWNKVVIWTIHLVAHSLGAYVAAAAGKYIKQWSNNTETIDRITGLDPSPVELLYTSPVPNPLTWQHARFVDIIHTDNGFLGLGTNQNTGHVDFLPNGGDALQPGCTSIPFNMNEYACSHFRSMVYWGESVQRKDYVSFLSTKNNDPSVKIQMGNNCPTFGFPTGVYILETNNATWFSKS